MSALALDPAAVSLAEQNASVPDTVGGELLRVNLDGNGVGADGVGLHQEVVLLGGGLVASGPDLKAEHTSTSRAQNLRLNIKRMR